MVKCALSEHHTCFRHVWYVLAEDMQPKKHAMKNAMSVE